MSAAWLCIPSKRPPEEAAPILEKWREQGYKIALAREPKDGAVKCDLFWSVQRYHGWAQSINILAQMVLDGDPGCNWIVGGGDDTTPDPNHTAEEIARQCSEHFAKAPYEAIYRHMTADVPIPEHLQFNDERLRSLSDKQLTKIPCSTFGVMQPTGDRWLDSKGQCAIDRICGSPWIGREFAKRINQGRGPLWPEYHHMFADEELQNVALKYGVLWQRRDLIHEHKHWARPRGYREDMPQWAAAINSPEEWRASQTLFSERKAAGFPGSEPL